VDYPVTPVRFLSIHLPFPKPWERHFFKQILWLPTYNTKLS
jgi:hypothetical protein